MSLRLAPLTLLASLLVAQASIAATLTRHPSLWNVTPQSIVIAWQTDVVTSGKILYGTTPALGSEVADPRDSTDHAVTLTGLSPATRYYYEVLADGSPLTAGDDTLHTAPDGAAPFRFVAFGDCGTGDANQAAVAARVDALNPDLGLILGDVIYEAGEPQNFTPRYFTPYRPTIRRSVFYPVVGNHDIGTANGQPFLDAFYLPANSVDGTEKYYSFDYGNAHFVAIDGNQTANTAMYAWVEGDLAATTKRWKFVYFHQPIYSNPGGHGSDLTLRSHLDPIFSVHNVDLVFAGHNHFFSRSYPIAYGAAVDTAQGSSYHNPGGTIHLVSGGGGRALYAVTANDPLTRSAFSVFHTMVVDVVGDSVNVRAVLPNGAVFDSFSIVKSTPTAVEVVDFTASGVPEGIRIQWRATGATHGFDLFRGTTPSATNEPLNREGPIQGGPEYSFLDTDVEPGRVYSYRLYALDGAGKEEPVGLVQAAGGALRFGVSSPRPNPSGGETQVAFTLPRASDVRITICDASGRQVRTLVSRGYPAGVHAVSWDGKDDRGRPAASGVYFASVRAQGRELRTRIVLVR